MNALFQSSKDDVNDDIQKCISKEKIRAVQWFRGPRHTSNARLCSHLKAKTLYTRIDMSGLNKFRKNTVTRKARARARSSRENLVLLETWQE